MAKGTASPDDMQFTVSAKLTDDHYGILTDATLDSMFHTTEFTNTITTSTDGTLSYSEDTVLIPLNLGKPFHHTDTMVLKKIAEPTPNPLAIYADKDKTGKMPDLPDIYTSPNSPMSIDFE